MARKGWHRPKLPHCPLDTLCGKASKVRRLCWWKIVGKGEARGHKTGMVQKQVTPQGWLMSTPEGDAPDPTLTRWGLAGCRQLDPQPSRSCHSRRSAC